MRTYQACEPRILLAMSSDREFVFWEDSTRVRFVQAVRDGIEICSGSLGANARLEASHQLKPVVVRSGLQPEICAESVELQRHDSDKCCRLAAPNEDLTEDFGIATELSLPESIVHYEHWRSTRASIFLGDRTAQQRRYTQVVKGIGRYHSAEGEETNRFAVIIRMSHMRVSNEIFKYMILLPKGAHFFGREMKANFCAADI